MTTETKIIDEKKPPLGEELMKRFQEVLSGSFCDPYANAENDTDDNGDKSPEGESAKERSAPESELKKGDLKLESSQVQVGIPLVMLLLAFLVWGLAIYLDWGFVAKEQYNMNDLGEVRNHSSNSRFIESPVHSQCGNSNRRHQELKCGVCIVEQWKDDPSVFILTEYQL